MFHKLFFLRGLSLLVNVVVLYIQAPDQPGDGLYKIFEEIPTKVSQNTDTAVSCSRLTWKQGRNTLYRFLVLSLDRFSLQVVETISTNLYKNNDKLHTALMLQYCGDASSLEFDKRQQQGMKQEQGRRRILHKILDRLVTTIVGGSTTWRYQQHLYNNLLYKYFFTNSDACCSVMMHQVSMTSKNRAQEQKKQRMLLGLVVECGVPDEQQAMISKPLRILDTVRPLDHWSCVGRWNEFGKGLVCILYCKDDEGDDPTHDMIHPISATHMPCHAWACKSQSTTFTHLSEGQFT